MESGKKFGHIMVDIETMGNESNSAIVSIGAVEFNMETGETGQEFYANVSLKSCLDAGLKVNADTVMWWMKQGDEARKTLTVGESKNIIQALDEFSSFVEFCGGKECQAWGNSARFDLGILTDAYNKINVKTPWDFRNERCVRTLASFSPQIKKDAVFIGTPHYSIDDCKFQIHYCSEIWNALNTVKHS
jgi:hypothetical protein